MVLGQVRTVPSDFMLTALRRLDDESEDSGSFQILKIIWIVLFGLLAISIVLAVVIVRQNRQTQLQRMSQIARFLENAQQQRRMQADEAGPEEATGLQNVEELFPAQRFSECKNRILGLSSSNSIPSRGGETTKCNPSFRQSSRVADDAVTPNATPKAVLIGSPSLLEEPTATPSPASGIGGVSTAIRTLLSKKTSELLRLEEGSAVGPTISLDIPDVCCVICLSGFKSSDMVRVLSCKHAYHRDCIDDWFGMHTFCPLCNRDFKPPKSDASKAADDPTSPTAGGDTGRSNDTSPGAHDEFISRGSVRSLMSRQGTTNRVEPVLLHHEVEESVPVSPAPRPVQFFTQPLTASTSRESVQ